VNTISIRTASLPTLSVRNIPFSVFPSEWLAITAAAALLLGLLVSPFAARLLPFGWDAGVAATILHADRWSAGQALMKSSNPGGWETLATEMKLAEANHDALSMCREAAARTKKEQHCAIVVPPPAGDPAP
jgi:hypothetical protein